MFPILFRHHSVQGPHEKFRASIFELKDNEYPICQVTQHLFPQWLKCHWQRVTSRLHWLYTVQHDFCQFSMLLNWFLLILCKSEESWGGSKNSVNGTLATAAAQSDAELILWGLKRLKSIPASFKVVLIHRDVVSLLAASYGLTLVTSKRVIVPGRGLGSARYSLTTQHQQHKG